MFHATRFFAASFASIICISGLSACASSPSVPAQVTATQDQPSPNDSPTDTLGSTPTTPAALATASETPSPSLNEFAKQETVTSPSGYVADLTVHSTIVQATVDTANALPGRADVLIYFQTYYEIKNETPNRNATLEDLSSGLQWIKTAFTLPHITDGNCTLGSNPCQIMMGGGWNQSTASSVSFSAGESKQIPDFYGMAYGTTADVYGIDADMATCKLSVSENEVPQVMEDLKDKSGWSANIS